MTQAHLQQVDTSRGGCYTCTHWHGEIVSQFHTVCRDKRGPTVIAMPEQGCAFWEREVGADDEVPPAVARYSDF